MAIDTRYVAIVPRFDTRAFNNIKKKIEGIGKGLSEIKVGYKLNSRSLAGLKTALNSQIKNGKFLISVPVTYKKPSLSGLKSELKTSIADGKHSLKYPVTFSITGAKTKLLADLKGKKFSSIKIPVKFSLVGAKKELVSKLKANSFAAVRLPTVFSLKGAKKQLKLDIEALINKRIRIPVDIVVRDGSRVGAGGSGGGSNRGGGFGSRLSGATDNLAAYGTIGLAGSIISSGAKSAYDLETNLLYMKSVYDATVGGIDEDKLLSIRDKVMETAANFPITVNQASDAMRILAKNGASVGQIMGGMFDESVKASLALRTDVGITADFMTDAGRTFKLAAGEYDKLSRTLVGTTFSSKFDVQDVWYAFAQSSSQAAASGLTPEELGALLTTTQATAKTGRDLGTQLKNFFRFFTVAKSKPAEKLMKEYGLDAAVFSGDGSLKNVQSWIKELQKLKDLKDSEKLKVVNDIFGADASKAALALINGGVEEFIKNLTIIQNTNIDTAITTQMSGIAGAIDSVKSKFQELFNTIINQEVIDFTSASINLFADSLKALTEGAKLYGGIIEDTNSLLSRNLPGYKMLAKTVSLKQEGNILDVVRHYSPFATSVAESRQMFNQMQLNNIPTLREDFLKNKLLYGENTPEMSFANNIPPSSNMSISPNKTMTQNIIFNGPVNEPDIITDAVNRGRMLDNDSSLNNGLIYLN